ncbi:MAG: MAPEG family protein [Xanthomonadaceae bacterium]|nr:MAPEG family protein [Xanthomonadaceae bacterium]MDE1964379.1 MAPEG family protein [Xanthomonadaceae bacterium]
MSHGLLVPMAAHVLLSAVLYVLLTIARAPAVWGIGRRPDGSNPLAAIEPRIGANLSNQFEWPLFFHVACLLLLQLPPTREAPLLAWIFIVGRLLHSAVQILVPDLRLRGAVFTINFLAVLGLWALVVRDAIGHAVG